MDYGIKILIVEDQLTTRLFLKRTLKKLGYYNVVIVDDGEKALSELHADDYDLIISDWHMPNMDGLDFFKAVRNGSILKKIPFLLVTVETEKDKVVQAMKAGIDHYIVKPAKPEDLDSRIKQIFEAVEY